MNASLDALSFDSEYLTFSEIRGEFFGFQIVGSVPNEQRTIVLGQNDIGVRYPLSVLAVL